MHRFKRLITAVFLTVVSIILLLSVAFVYFIITPSGGKILVRCFKQQFLTIGLMHVGHFQGTLQDGFVLKDVRVKGLSYLPDATLRIQEIDVHLPLWDLYHSDVYIFNARIFMPFSDPVIFTGRISEGQIKGDLYAAAVDLHAATRFWASDDIKKNLQGFVSNIDLNVDGPLFSPHITGPLVADGVRYKSIILKNVQGRANLILDLEHQVQLQGELDINSGIVNVRKVDLQLAPSRFIFRADLFNPIIDLHLGGKVEDMQVNLALKGPSNSPQMTVTSDPPMPPQDALQVLFTGNAWSASTSPFNGVSSGELAENFLDYSLQDMDNDQNIGLKTKLTNNFKVGAEMDELPLPPGETNTYYSRRVNGEMDMNEHMSLNVSKEFFPQDSYPSYEDAQPESDTQVYVQYKKRF